MKKLISIAIACISFTSCVKEYECYCEDPITTESGTLPLRSQNEAEARRLCEDYQSKVNNSINDDYSCTLN